MPRKIKVQRKEAEEPDEFISTSGRIAAYVKKNYRMLVPVAGMVLVLLLIVIVWYYYRAERERSARETLHQAVAVYLAGSQAEADTPSSRNFREALTQLTSLEENYRGTRSAVRALFYMGESAYHLQEYDTAIDYYTRFLSRSGPGEYLRSFAYEGLGYCYEDKKDYAQAIEFYKRALKEPSVALPDLLYIAVARCYEMLNDTPNALDYYRKVTGDQKESVLLTIAADKISSLAP